MARSSSKLAVWNRALINAGETSFISDEEEDSPEAEICRLVYDDHLEQVLAARDWPFAMGEAALTSVAEQSQDFDDDGVSLFELPFAVKNTAQVVVELDGTELTAGTDYEITPSDIDTPATVTLTTPLGAGEVLTVTLTMTRNGWEFIYALPNDFVRAVGLPPEDAIIQEIPESLRTPFVIMPGEGDGDRVLVTNDDEFDSLHYVRLIENPAAWPRAFLEAVAWRVASDLVQGLRKDRNGAMSCLQMSEQFIAKAFAENSTGQHTVEPETPSLAIRR